MSNKAVQVALEAEMVDRFERLAAEQDRPAWALLEETLSGHLIGEEEIVAERKLLAERIEALDCTGLHLTHEDVSDWMERRMRGEDAPAPTPHT